MAGSGPNSAVTKWPRIQLDLPLSFRCKDIVEICCEPDTALQQSLLDERQLPILIFVAE